MRIGIFLAMLAYVNAYGATFTLNKDQPFGNSWNTAADWDPIGGPPGAGDVAIANSNNMRTPTASNTLSANLQMNGTSRILLKTTGTATISSATFNGGGLNQAIAPNSSGTFAGNFAIPGSMSINLAANTGDNRSMNLAASLSGAGLVSVDGSSGGGVGGR